ncbi:MAG: restriction endonuclease subunit S [Hydrogenophaga sp.]|uniref:restriction endonuclease subunit S n=1 Tax=Hydrogenophaga sp. TaxID=1904254 RepID=UPI003D9B505F
MTWPLAKLGDVCELNPKLPKGHPLRDDTEVSFVPMAAVSELSCSITAPQVRSFSEVRKGYTFFCEDDVLFAKITPCMENGKAAIARNLANGHGFGSTEFHVLRAKAEVLPEWLHFYVRQPSFRHEAKRNFTGTGGQQRVPVSFLAGSDIPLPPLSEQRRIVDLLTRAEGIVRLRREAAAKAAELIPALFIHHFGDPATNPMGWPVAPLSEVAEVISGVAKGRKLTADEGVELPYMRVANVKDGYLDLGEVKTIEIKRTEVDKLRIEFGDLLMTEGGDPDKLGRGALWRGEIENCVHQNHVFKVRSHRDRLVPEYLRSLVGSHYGKSYFLSVAKKTTGIASINKTQLSAFPVQVPPLPLQEAFRGRVWAAESIQRQQNDALAKAQATFDALLAQAFAPA